MVAVMRMWLSTLLSVGEKDQGLVEYALIIVLIPIVSIGILGSVGRSVQSVFTLANTALQPAGTGTLTP